MIANKKLSIILGLFFIWATAVAQDRDETVPLSTVTVTGQPQRADTVTVIDREEIDNTHASVAYDVLENQPGLNVVRRLGFTGSGLSRLTIRGNGGVGPAGIQVFVDGRPDATVSFAHPTPSALTLENVARIEVIHGPSPVLHGSGKTGVVNIITAAPEAGLHGALEASYGSFDTTENFGRLSYGGERGYARISGSYQSTDGDNPNSDAFAKSINFKAGFDITDHIDATFSVGRNIDSFDVFNGFFVPGPFTDPRTDSLDLTQTVLDATLNMNFGNIESSLKFFYDDLEPRSQILDGNEQRADIHEKGIRFKTTWNISGRSRLISGVDYLRAEAENSPVLPPFRGAGLMRPRARVSERLNELGIYGFIEHSFAPWLEFSGGARYTDHSAYDTELSGEAGLVYTPVWQNVDNPLYGTAFRVKATRGFQSPSLQQLFGIFRAGQNGPANFNIQPEIIKQFEVGLNKSFAKADIDVVFYVQDGEGLIELPASPPPPPPDIENNIDYVNRGIEAKLHYFPTDNWKTMLGISIADFENNNNRFLRAPEKTLDFGITYYHSMFKKNDFSISLFGRYAKDITDVPFGAQTQVKLDDYFVADMKINYHINQHVKTFFEIDNITDSNYQLVAGIPAPSFSIFTGIKINY